MVLGGVVQQRGDRVFLGAAVVEHDRRDAEQVRDVRNASALSVLFRVNLARVAHRLIKSRCQRRHSCILTEVRSCPGGAKGPADTTMSDPQKVYDALDGMGIQYEKYEHPPVFTGEEAAEHWGPIKATHVKNLFLRNKKGNR